MVISNLDLAVCTSATKEADTSASGVDDLARRDPDEGKKAEADKGGDELVLCEGGGVGDLPRLLLLPLFFLLCSGSKLDLDVGELC